MKKFDFESVSTYEGHVTIDAFNCVCGYEYVYYGILSRQDRIMFPRAKNNYLKHTILKDVPCNECKSKMYEILSQGGSIQDLVKDKN